ncbi:MAG: hypothetical protein ACXADW_18655 [Candidatus Hodarchaeales archaeon]|jgi:hypothetical protein
MKLSKEAIDKIGIKFNIPFGEKQSIVYTTFRLSPEAHAAIKDVAQSRNLTLIEVFDTLLSFIEEIEEDKTLNLFDFSEKKSKEKDYHRARKTYAMKKETAEKLKNFSKDKKISRDVLIDTTIRFLKALIDHMSSENRKKYPQILKDVIEPFSIEAEDIEMKLIEELGDNDPVRSRFGFITTMLMALAQEMEKSIEEGTSVDPYG